MFALGRHTITQMLLMLGLTEEDWSAWYRVFSEGRFAEEASSRVLLREQLSEVSASEPFVVGLDGFPVPRESQTMPGTGWMRGLRTAKFRPGIQRGQRFVEGSWLPPIVKGYSRALPIRSLPAFTAKSVPCAGVAPCTEVAAGLALLGWIRAEMDKAGRCEQALLSLQDGSYDTLDFWAGLPARTIAVARTARNRALFYLPAADAHGNCKYGEKAPAPAEWLQQRKGFQKQDIMVRGQRRSVRYRVVGPVVRDGQPDIPLFLIVVGGGKRPKGSRRKNYKPCFFLVSAVLINGVWSLPLPIAHLLAWLWQRWELEVAHRQLKSGLGLGEKQCWNDKATVATVQWSVWLYGLVMLAAYRTWGNDPGPKPPGLWCSAPKRWSSTPLGGPCAANSGNCSDFRPT
ncbi:MAG: transposase [Caldilineaceae bacterium]